jgi:GNAT superfamily N-acetyltransferase
MSGTTCPDPALVLPAPGGERLPRAAPGPSSAGPALLRRLGPPDLAAVERHLLALGPEDRRTRFLSRFGDAVISAYVRRIDPVAGILFGALDGPEGELLGLAEAYPTGAPGRVEVAVSVLPAHRRRGLGRRLVGRAVAAGFAAGAAVAEFHFAPENLALARLVASLGGRVGPTQAELHRGG